MRQPIQIGALQMGGGLPVSVQSMTLTPTMDAEATARQCIVLANAGADLVRITAQNLREAEALKEIRERLRAQNIHIPLVADVHFNADIALAAAKYVEKVRINPGNFLGGTDVSLSEDEYNNVLQKKFYALLSVCREHHTALRIGVNHGSLSERILRLYGNTPAGMTEAAMEYLRLCRAAGFANAAVSMKSSSARIMVYAVRLLAMAMEREGMYFPLHLGVTEAGDGDDGRIKSAVGIGALLLEGLGDTIRISLTEPPENEITAAKKLVEYVEQCAAGDSLQPISSVTSYSRRHTLPSAVSGVGGGSPVSVWADLSRLAPVYSSDIERLGFAYNGSAWQPAAPCVPDVIYIGSSVLECPASGLCIVDDNCEYVLRCDASFLSRDFFVFLQKNPRCVLLFENGDGQSVYAARLFFKVLEKQQITNAVVICRRYDTANFEALQLQASADCGALLLDGYGDGIMLSTAFEAEREVQAAFGILQAAQARISKTEYIACPGCGRTLYDIQAALREVRAKTSHLAGLKIAVMGCIVNGLGEMADADYGFVGSGRDRISLYKGRRRIHKDLPLQDAANALLSLINETHKK